MDVQRPGCPREFFNIKVPKRHIYNPDEKDDLEMPFLRSRFDQRTGQTPNNPRQQVCEMLDLREKTFIYVVIACLIKYSVINFLSRRFMVKVPTRVNIPNFLIRIT